MKCSVSNLWSPQLQHLANWTPCGKKRQQQKQISIFFTYRYTNRKVAAASLYFCRKPGTITLVTTRMVPSTYALHRAHNLAPSLLPSLSCVCFILFLSRLLLCASIQLLSTYRKKNSYNLAYCLSSRSLLENSFMHSRLRGFL